MVTVISKARNFAFIHIPKCGGMSIRIGLEAALKKDSQDTWHYGTIIEHPEAGRHMPAHKPLPFLERYFTDELDAYRSAECYAVIRDPHARFASAMQQHIREFLDTNIGNMSQKDLQTAVDKVIKRISAEPVFSGVEYIHFTRQVDYVSLNGEEIVKHTFPIERLGDMAEAMTRQLGEPMSFVKSDNVSSGPPGFALRQLASLGKVVRPIAPEGAYKAIRKALKSKLSEQVDQGLMDTFRSDYVTSFINEFYADDAALHRKLLGKPAEVTLQRALT